MHVTSRASARTLNSITNPVQTNIISSFLSEFSESLSLLEIRRQNTTPLSFLLFLFLLLLGECSLVLLGAFLKSGSELLLLQLFLPRGRCGRLLLPHLKALHLEALRGSTFPGLGSSGFTARFMYMYHTFLVHPSRTLLQPWSALVSMLRWNEFFAVILLVWVIACILGRLGVLAETTNRRRNSKLRLAEVPRRLSSFFQ